MFGEQKTSFGQNGLFTEGLKVEYLNSDKWVIAIALLKELSKIKEHFGEITVIKDLLAPIVKGIFEIIHSIPKFEQVQVIEVDQGLFIQADGSVLTEEGITQLKLDPETVIYYDHFINLYHTFHL